MGEEHKTALVIEDNEALARLLDAMLARLGFAVRTAENGKAGATAIADHNGDPDLIILDYSLPDATGPEMVDHCRRHAPTSKLLLTSGFAADMLADVDVGAIDGFLKKPFDFDQICDTLMELMTEPTLHGTPEQLH